MQLVTRNRIYVVLVMAVTAITQAGCVGLVANLVHTVRGDKVPAEFEGLKNQRVAVITVSDSSIFENDPAARMLAREVGEILEVEVDGLKLVREEEIAAWRDNNGWDQLDFVTIGRGVKADKVVAIELIGLKLRDGATLYRGQVTATTTVYDVATSSKEFRRNLEDYSYPVTGGQYTSETTEKRFRKVFLAVLSDRIARYFHAYDFRDSVALDAALINQ